MSVVTKADPEVRIKQNNPDPLPAGAVEQCQQFTPKKGELKQAEEPELYVGASFVRNADSTHGSCGSDVQQAALLPSLEDVGEAGAEEAILDTSEQDHRRSSEYQVAEDGYRLSEDCQEHFAKPQDRRQGIFSEMQVSLSVAIKYLFLLGFCSNTGLFARLLHRIHILSAVCLSVSYEFKSDTADLFFCFVLCMILSSSHC